MSKRILYIDCFSGIAGDMMLGALLDLGVPEDLLRTELEKLELGHWHLHVGRALRHTISGVDVQVHVSSTDDHDHDHSHDPPQTQSSHDEGHVHGRTWKTIRTLIENSSLSDSVKEVALKAFRSLARAEGKLHGVDPDDIHFHEVGAVDAIVDICGAAIGLDWLNVDAVISAPVPAPRGWVDCAHGKMPLPAPATMELLRGAELQSVASEGELVTPTGAAILTTIVTGYGSLPSMTVDAIGYGAGDTDRADRPNLLRLILGTQAHDNDVCQEYLIEANIDDMNPEIYGFLSERLFEAGADDVWLTPIQMKKGRPATQLSVLVGESVRESIMQTILRETTSIGVRTTRVHRFKATREVETIQTAYGPVRIKVARDGDRIINRAPEYEDCRQLALTSSVPLKDVMQAVYAALAVER